MKCDEVLKNSLFTFFLCNKNETFNALPKHIDFGDYRLWLSEKTEADITEKNGRTVAIVGLCIDSRAEININIPAFILDNSKSLQDVLRIEGRFAGKYVLIYEENCNLYIIGDATCSIPVNYCVNDQFAVSSSSELIAARFGFCHSHEYLEIRRASDVSQALPYNITLYKEVEQLLPNHYFDVSKRRSFRFTLNSCGNLSIGDAARMTAELIHNITKEYANRCKLICPLTSGKDSRVVLAFLRRHVNDLICYTIKHRKFRSDEPDLVIPKEIARKLGIEYKQVEDSEVPENIIESFDGLFGKDLYSKYTLMNAYTIKENFKDFAIVNGDIIGQIGKSSLHRNIPDKWASTSYFMCKLHNNSKKAKVYLKKWYKNAKCADDVSMMDKFSWEIRLGRWAGQENAIYNILGVLYLNIFNCRDIIIAWTQTDRKLRKNSGLHKGILSIVDSELLDIPFGSDRNLLYRIARSSDFAFFISSFLKHWFCKGLFYLGKKGGWNEKANNNSR